MTFKPLTTAEFKTYLQKSIQNYAKELAISNDIDGKKATKQAEKQFNSILPDGLDTKGHFLHHAYDKNEKVGFIWYGLRSEDSAFIYDFSIEESQRRKGYGKQVMLACEKKVKQKGVKTIRLHVFGHNNAARALYGSLDYEPTSIQMKKEL